MTKTVDMSVGAGYTADQVSLCAPPLARVLLKLSANFRQLRVALLAAIAQSAL